MSSDAARRVLRTLARRRVARVPVRLGVVVVALRGGRARVRLLQESRESRGGDLFGGGRRQFHSGEHCFLGEQRLFGPPYGRSVPPLVAVDRDRACDERAARVGERDFATVCGDDHLLLRLEASASGRTGDLHTSLRDLPR